MRRLLWLLLLLAWTPPLQADVIRYRFIATDARGSPALTPIGPGGAVGERTAYRGGAPEPYATIKRPTHFLVVVHPETRRKIQVPLTLPEDTPRVERRAGSIVYNYGTYTVEVVFLRDGSVETVYNSGFLRRLSP